MSLEEGRALLEYEKLFVDDSEHRMMIVLIAPCPMRLMLGNTAVFQIKSHCLYYLPVEGATMLAAVILEIIG